MQKIDRQFILLFIYLWAAIQPASAALADQQVDTPHDRRIHSESEDNDWPQWRGREGQGHAQATALPTTFNDSENTKWRVDLPGKGWSSPAIVGRQIWMTYAIEAPADDAALEVLAERKNASMLTISGAVTFHAICVDRTTGELIHDINLLTDEHPQPIHTLNSYASPSPIVDGERVFCHFGAHGTICLNSVTGETIWTNLEVKIDHENGPGSTPMLWRDLLIFHCDGIDDQFIVALDANTGEKRWQTSRSGEMHENPQLQKSYGTPIVIETESGPQLISTAANWVYGYHPATGEERWRVEYGALGFSIVPRPVFGNDRVYFSTSFMQPQVIALRFDDGVNEPSIDWKQSRQAPNTPSLLLLNDELYMVSDNGIASCLNSMTGDVYWAERLGGNFSSSPIFADGKLYFGNRDGKVFVIAPGREFELLAVNELDSAVMATPAAVGTALYIRTERSLYCFEQTGSNND